MSRRRIHTERLKRAPWHCDCGRRWDGLAQVHCAAALCHRHFGSVSAFDLHRAGPVDSRYCADPASAIWGLGSKYADLPRLKPVDGPHGVTWVLTVYHPGPAYPGCPAVAPAPAIGYGAVSS